MHKPLITFIVCLLSAAALFAQDIHYSQFYADPIRLNVANTGNFNGNYRFGINARSQWQSVSTPYQTLSAYADFGLLKIGKRDWIGLGVYTLIDRAGDGVLTTVEARGSAAMHKGLSDNVYLSLGAGFAYVQKSIDFQKLYFGNQWSEDFFDPSIDPNENFDRNSFGYLDVQGGLNLTYHFQDNLNMYAGASVLHLNQPNVSFSDANQNQLGVRSIFVMGGAIGFKKFSLEPALYFTTQKKASEFVLGSNFTMRTGNNPRKSFARFYVGSWYRWKDAVVILTGIELSSYRFLVSYDINISELVPASRRRGGLELSLVHVGAFSGKDHKPIYCPRF